MSKRINALIYITIVLIGGLLGGLYIDKGGITGGLCVSSIFATLIFLSVKKKNVQTKETKEVTQ